VTQQESGAVVGCHCTALRKAARRISQLYDLALAPSGLKATQRAILSQIDRLGSTTVGNLAEILVMDAGGLAHTLKPLARDGLVSIVPDPQDRRSRLIRLTRAGQARLKQSEAQWRAAQSGLEQQMGPGRTNELHRAIQFLISDEFAEAFEKSMGSR
jgi:DNA-binding MarR family transcriptional regulator